jgi:hypothetical protein
MDVKGIGRTELASAIGISYQGVRKVFDSDGAFGSENNLKAAAYFKVNPQWLATGEGERSIAPVEQHDYSRQQGEPASPTAMEIALLFDLIPTTDRIRRTQAYNAATAAILNILQSKPATPGE